ncbi:MAG: hypothetical protein F6J95_007710 [Leptolyngbya sp. SIO1E4]|nr:hypothetical protein [Leptolyngbya sp. SIO1E4]
MVRRDIQAEVRSVNLWLKAECYRVAIQIRGKRLSLAATLPPKPNSTKVKSHQQRIPLKLGATLAGLRRAKAQAILLADQLDREKFNWADWIDFSKDEPEVKTCKYWLEKFKAHVWPDLPDDKEFNWTKRYLYFGLNKLPLDKPLTPEVLVAAVLTKKAGNKASRDRACIQLQRLANYAGIDVDLSPFRVGYSSADVTPKEIPGDNEIERVISDISNPQWRYVFALMAIYGLRDHEAFLCNLEERNGVLVAVVPDNTKTGQHIAYPHPAKWVELWLMGERDVPLVKAKANSDYGASAAEYWRRIKAPETPYTLRHAYAIRHIGKVDSAIVASWMGHSPEMHRKTYQRWISESVQKDAWQKLQSKSE